MTNSKLIKTTLPPIFAVLIAICGMIKIPASIPITMQLFGLYVTIFAIGGKGAFASVIIYLTLAALGLPVISSGTCGITALIGPTGGYIWGMVISALIFMIAEKRRMLKDRSKYILAAIGLIVIYTLGTVWYAVMYAGKGLSLFSVLATCILPFVIPDIIKLWLGAAVGIRLRKIIVKNLRSSL